MPPPRLSRPHPLWRILQEKCDKSSRKYSTRE